MSTVRDSEGNILNRVPRQVAQGRYTDAETLVQDWFDKHPEDRPLVASVDEPTVADPAGLLSETLPGEPRATVDSNNDVPQDGLPSGLPDAGLVGTPTDAVQEPAGTSEQPTSDVPQETPAITDSL